MNRNDLVIRAVGVAVFLTALWGGSYVMYFHAAEWYGFPTLLSAIIGGFGGFMAAGLGEDMF